MDALIAWKIPDCIQMGLCKADIFRNQELNFSFGSLHPEKERVKGEDFTRGGGGRKGEEPSWGFKRWDFFMMGRLLLSPGSAMSSSLSSTRFP